MKIFTTNIYEKYPFSIQGWDSNPRPSDHESHPVTTRPGQFCLCEHSWCALFVPQYLFAKNWIKPKSNSRAAKYPNKLKGERWKQVGSGPNAKIHTAKYYESFKRMRKNQCDQIVFFFIKVLSYKFSFNSILHIWQLFRKRSVFRKTLFGQRLEKFGLLFIIASGHEQSFICDAI